MELQLVKQLSIEALAKDAKFFERLEAEGGNLGFESLSEVVVNTEFLDLVQTLYKLYVAACDTYARSLALNQGQFFLFFVK